jgi:hypothetical protein
MQLIVRSAVGAMALSIFCHATPGWAQSNSELQREIQELRRRLNELERQAAPPQTVPPSPSAPSQRQAPPPSSATAESATVERALERSLIEQGGLLLPPGTLDITPTLQYSHTSTSGGVGSAIFNPTTNVLTLSTLTTRQDSLESAVFARYGLPYDAQFNVHVPFDVVWSESATSAGGTTSRTDTGLGDIDFGISKQFLYEHGPVPDAIASLQWKTTTGSAHFASLAGGPVSFTGGTGSGFNQLTAGVTLTKRQDPLVFFGGGFYTFTFSDKKAGSDFAPGDQIDARLGTILAASPDTSLRFLFDTAWVQRTKINGIGQPGSDVVASFLEIGASSVLSASTLVDVAADVGLTRSTPDFRFILSFPIHF